MGWEGRRRLQPPSFSTWSSQHMGPWTQMFPCPLRPFVLYHCVHWLAECQTQHLLVSELVTRDRPLGEDWPRPTWALQSEQGGTDRSRGQEQPEAVPRGWGERTVGWGCECSLCLLPCAPPDAFFGGKGRCPGPAGKEASGSQSSVLGQGWSEACAPGVRGLCARLLGPRSFGCT